MHIHKTPPSSSPFLSTPLPIRAANPASSECGTCKMIKASFWSWLSDKSP